MVRRKKPEFSRVMSFSAQRPIVLLSDEQDEMEDALTTTRTGTIVRDGKALLAHLVDHLRMHEAGRALPFNPAEDALSLFDYGSNMQHWADLMEAALQNRRARA